MNNAVIIGNGTVGRATGAAFGIEKYYSRSESNITLEEIRRYRYVFICLPTPTLEDKCDVSAITEFIKQIMEKENECVFIIRSTVYPRYNQFLQGTFGIDRFVSNPEFLSEDTAMNDAKNPDLVVIGSDREKYREEIKALYAGRYKYSPTYVTDSVTAELIKYTLNTFFATKVIFANEIFDYAQKLRANYGEVKKAIEAHPWGSKNHFGIWHKGGRGAGGKCLEKDLEATALSSGSVFFQAVHIINQRLLEDNPKNG